MYQKNDILFHVGLITSIGLRALWILEKSGKHVSLKIPLKVL